jgi:hypothetical protein
MFPELKFSLDKGYDLQAILSYRNAVKAGFDSPSIRKNMATIMTRQLCPYKRRLPSGSTNLAF